MTRTEIMTDFLKKSVLPALLAMSLYNLFIGISIQYGTVNYMYLLMLCGIPFGIRFMFSLPIFVGYMSVWIFALCMNIAIGGLIGGFILIWKLLVVVWYVPVTVFRFITA